MNAEHRAICEACLARDVDEAVRLNDGHREHVLERMGAG